jgi:hypothetical protein
MDCSEKEIEIIIVEAKFTFPGTTKRFRTWLKRWEKPSFRNRGLADKPGWTTKIGSEVTCSPFVPFSIWARATTSLPPGNASKSLRAFRRYAGLLKDRKDLLQKKYVLERVPSNANIEDREMDQIFSEYMNSLNRFDLVRLSSSSDGDAVRIGDLKRKAWQMDFLFDLRKTASTYHDHFRERVSKLV